MAASYRVDSAAGTVFASLEGSINEKELLRYAQLLINDPDFSPSFDQVMDISSAVAFSGDADAPRTVAPFDPFSESSRWSFVVGNALQYGLLRMFIGQAGLDHEYALFFDQAQARAWLGLDATAQQASSASSTRLIGNNARIKTSRRSTLIGG